MSPAPTHHTIVVTDIEKSRSQSDPDKTTAREEVYRVVRTAFEDSGLDWNGCRVEDRGDGIYLLAPADWSKIDLVTAVDRIHQLLGERRVGDVPLRLRLVLHAGEVTVDEEGSSGDDVNTAFELINHDEVRAALRAAARATLVLVTSDAFYRSVILPEHAGMDPTRFRKRLLTIRGEQVPAWLTVYGVTVQPVPPPTEPETSGHTGPPVTGAGGSIHNLGPVLVAGDQFTGGKTVNLGNRP